MHRNPFTLPFDRLPADIAVFPLSGAVLMPGTQLPLNVFEPRYLNMVEDALGARRLIGMIQPLDEDERVLSKTGCAGRISSFSETDDGRIILVLTGLCRFDVVDELPLARGYRRVRADWTRFNGDYQDPAENEIDRTGLTDALESLCGIGGCRGFLGWLRESRRPLAGQCPDRQFATGQQAEAVADRNRFAQRTGRIAEGHPGNGGGRVRRRRPNAALVYRRWIGCTNSGKCVVGGFANLASDPGVVKLATCRGILVMGMGDGTMQVPNPEVL